MKTIRNVTCAVLGLALALLSGNDSQAAETDYEIRIGASRSDNIRRTETLEQDETIGIVGLIFNVTEDTGRFTGSLRSDLEFNKYMDDTFDDQNDSTVAALANFQITPTFLSWTFEDHFGRTISDPFLADTPANRENVNSFTTGPNFAFTFDQRTSMEINGRHTINSFETSNVDNTILGGKLALVRAISPTRSLSFNATADRIDFDDEIANSSFDRQAAYVGVQSRTARGNLSMNIGVNQIHDRGESQQGLLAGVDWTRELSGSSSFTFSYNQRYSEVGELFSLYQGSGRDFNQTQDISTVGGPLQNQRLGVFYNFVKQSTNFYAGATWNDDDFEQSDTRDRQRTGVQGGFSRELGAGWRVGLDLRFEKHDFYSAIQDQTYDEFSVRANITRRLTRTLAVTGSYARTDRTSDPLIPGYTENRYTVLLTYRPDNQ